MKERGEIDLLTLIVGLFILAGLVAGLKEAFFSSDQPPREKPKLNTPATQERPAAVPQSSQQPPPSGNTQSGGGGETR